MGRHVSRNRKHSHPMAGGMLGGILALRHQKVTSLLRRLRADPSLHASPPTGKILPFRKIAVTLKPVVEFECPLSIYNLLKK